MPDFETNPALGWLLGSVLIIPIFHLPERSGHFLSPSACLLQRPSLLLQQHQSHLDSCVLVCREKEVLEVLLVGEGRENLGKSGCGGWDRCPKVPVEGPWLVRVGSAMSCCRTLEMALCRGSAFPYRSIKIAVSRGV